MVRILAAALALFCLMPVARAWEAAPLTAQQAAHVLNRMSFGPRPGDIGRLQRMGLQAYVAEQLDPSRPDLLGETARRVHELASARVDAGPDEADDLARQERLLRAIASRRQLEEVLVGFWLQQKGEAGLGAAAQARMAQELRPRVFAPYSGSDSPAAWCRALADWFVGSAPPPLVARMEEAWRRSGGAQKEVLRALFTSPEFLAPAARSAKRKDPLRLLASAVRGSGMEVANAAPLAQAQRKLEEQGMAAWPEVAAALAEGRLALAAEAPRRHRQASVAPPVRAVDQAGGPVSPAQVRPEAPTPSAAAMAAATRTPPLGAQLMREALGLAASKGSAVELLGSEEFLRY